MTGQLPILPRAVELEAAVLGACFIDHRAANLASEMLARDDFYTSANQTIFGEILRQVNTGQGIGADIAVAIETLSVNGLLDGIGGANYLTGIASSCPGSAAVETQIRLVREASMKRALILAATEMARRGYEPGATAEELLRYHFERLAAVNGRLAGQQSRLDLGAVMAEVIAGLQGVAKRAAYHTGIASLDSMLGGGFMEKDLVVIGARPGCGKTTLCEQVARVNAGAGVPVLYLSYEVSSVNLGQAVVAGHARICIHKDGTVREENYELAVATAREIGGWPMYVEDQPPDISRIPALIRQQVQERGVKLVFVDYLQQVPVSGGDDNREGEVAKIARTLKACARDNQIVVVAAAQLNRAVNQAANVRPSLARLRESGAIEQEADIVVFLHDPELDSRTGERPLTVKMEAIVAKHRNGQIGSKEVEWQTGFRVLEEYCDRIPYSRVAPAVPDGRDG